MGYATVRARLQFAYSSDYGPWFERLGANPTKPFIILRDTRVDLQTRSRPITGSNSGLVCGTDIEDCEDPDKEYLVRVAIDGQPPIDAWMQPDTVHGHGDHNATHNAIWLDWPDELAEGRDSTLLVRLSTATARGGVLGFASIVEPSVH